MFTDTIEFAAGFFGISHFGSWCDVCFDSIFIGIADFRKVCDFCDVKEQVRHPLYPTRSMFCPAASSEIHYEPPTCSSVYELELIKAGGSEKKAKKAYKDFLHRTCEFGV